MDIAVEVSDPKPEQLNAAVTLLPVKTEAKGAG
jgi:hypothetical protein